MLAPTPTPPQRLPPQRYLFSQGSATDERTTSGMRTFIEGLQA